MTKYLMLLFIFLAVIFFSSCGRGTANQTGERHDLPFAEAAVNYDYMRYSYVFVDLFDTVSRVIGYARSQEEFYYFSRDIIYAELYRLSKLFDGFNSHEGINNIKVINESAGIYPVEVHPDIIQMLHAGIDAYHKTNGAVNMAIGPVTSIWREYISRGEEVLPSLDKLQAAGALTSITDVIINEEKNTVFLRHAGMSLDVGSIGKGFAIEQAAQKAFDAGFSSFVLSVGGDVRLFGGPIGGSRDTWGIGVTDPFHPGEITEAIFAANTAVFTSGNYLRFYVVDGVRYHHIIDPATFLPANHVSSATVVYPCAVMAEIFSLAAFVLNFDDAMELITRFGAQAMWVFPDGSIATTEGFNHP